VRALLENGLRGAALFDINPEVASTALSALLSDFPKARFIFKKVDVTDADNVRLAVEETANELGSVDVLCCYAGVVNCVHAIDMEPSQWRRVMEINTTGAFLCAQAAARLVKSSSIENTLALVVHAANY
jgi:sorbose reductase